MPCDLVLPVPDFDDHCLSILAVKGCNLWLRFGNHLACCVALCPLFVNMPIWRGSCCGLYNSSKLSQWHVLNKIATALQVDSVTIALRSYLAHVTVHDS